MWKHVYDKLKPPVVIAPARVESQSNEPRSSSQHQSDYSDAPTGSKRRLQDGETSSSKRKRTDPASELSKEEQCAGYALEALSTGLLRTHVLGVLIEGNMFKMWYYDRSVIATAAFHFMKDSLTLLKWFYVVSRLPAPGSDIFQTPAEEVSKENLTDKAAGPHWGKFLDLDPKTMPKIVLYKTIYRQHGLIGRGTCVIEGGWKILPTTASLLEWAQSLEQRFVVKISSPAASRVSEKSFVDRAVKAASENESDRRFLLSLPKIFYETTFENKCPNLAGLFGDVYEVRVLRLNIQEPLSEIQSIVDPLELAQVYVDLVEGLYSTCFCFYVA